jgi:hypothetical protein
MAGEMQQHQVVAVPVGEQILDVRPDGRVGGVVLDVDLEPAERGIAEHLGEGGGVGRGGGKAA